jgi:hypothetical protein
MAYVFSPLMKQTMKLCAVHSAASDQNPVVGCCEHGNGLFFLVQNKTVMNLWFRFERIDDVRGCRLRIGSSS